MSIYTIKLNHPGNNDFQLLGVVTKYGLEHLTPPEEPWQYLGNIQNQSIEEGGLTNLGIPSSLLKYKNTTFDHTPWLVPEITDGENTAFTPVSQMESLEKIEVRVISAKLTRSFSGDSFTASLPPDHPMRDCIIPYRTGIYIFENDALIWKGEVIQTTKKLSGELTLKAVGMTDIINYFCPIKQTFKETPAYEIVRTLIYQYNITVSNFRRVLIDPDFYTSKGPDEPVIGEYICDGITPLLSIIKDLTMVNSKDSGHWYVVMEEAEKIRKSMLFDTNRRSYEGVPESFFTDFYASAGQVPMMKYGYSSSVNPADENGMFQVKYGENLIDLKREQKGDGATVYLYEADQVEVITAGIRPVQTDDEDNSSEEEPETETYWNTETVPFYPGLYQVNTSKKLDENTNKWVDDEEAVHPIRYADIFKSYCFLINREWSDEVFNDITYFAPFLEELANLIVYEQPESVENEQDDAIARADPENYTFQNPDNYPPVSRIPHVLLPDIKWMIENYYSKLDKDGYHGNVDAEYTGGNISYLLNDTVDRGLPNYAAGEKTMHLALEIDADQNHPLKDFKDWYAFPFDKNPVDSHRMYINVQTVGGNGEPCPIGVITSQETIRLEGVNDYDSMHKVMHNIVNSFIPPAISTSCSCEAIDLSLFDNALVKAELGGYANVSATPDCDAFTGVITSITYDIVNSKKSVSIQKESENITDVIARALDRRSVLEKRFAVKSNAADITDQEIKNGDVIFIPE